MNVASVTFEGDATIAGDGTLSLPSWGTMIAVVSGTAEVSVALAGGGFTQTGPGTLILDGATPVPGTLIVDQGTLDLLAPAESAPVVAGGQAIGPGALFSSAGTSLFALDPAMFSLVQSLFVSSAEFIPSPSIGRADMIEILDRAWWTAGSPTTRWPPWKSSPRRRAKRRLNIPIYVGVLASDVVNGNPANPTSRAGRSGTSSTRRAAGNRSDNLDRKMVRRY